MCFKTNTLVEDVPRANRYGRRYLAIEGFKNLNVQILPAKGRIVHPFAVIAACRKAGIELPEDHESVLAKLARRQERKRSSKGPLLG
jgi:hypothetical protein